MHEVDRTVVTVQEIGEQLQTAGHGVVVLDVRYVLGQPDAGRPSFLQGHIPGACYLDLEEDLSDVKGEHEGRHPLPPPAVLCTRFAQVGIDPDTQVVVCDSGSGDMAPHAWWLLRYLGHEAVTVLDGGFAAWRAAGLPIESGNPALHPAVWQHCSPHREWVADRAYVGELHSRPATVLVDARDRERWAGVIEPIDRLAGHIPGAINIPWKMNFVPVSETSTVDAGRRWRSPEELRLLYAPLCEADEAVIYCGSGVTSCVDVLATQRAGLPWPRLYAGSWSDWISYREAPLATGHRP